MSLMFCLSLLFFKQKTAYEMRISDWSSDVCSSDLIGFRFYCVETGRKTRRGVPDEAQVRCMHRWQQQCGERNASEGERRSPAARAVARRRGRDPRAMRFGGARHQLSSEEIGRAHV